MKINKEKKSEAKSAAKRLKTINRDRKYKARILVHEKDPYRKALFYKMNSQQISDFLKQENKEMKQAKIDKRIKNLEFKHLNKKISTSASSKIQNYFVGVGKEIRKIRWQRRKHISFDSKLTFYFIITCALIFAALDLFISLFRYLNIM